LPFWSPTLGYLGSISYTYDNDGNVLTKVAPLPNQTGSATVTTTYGYDALHRLTGKTYSNGDPAVSYFYDQSSYNGLSITNGKERRTGMSDTSGATAWSYDSMGRALTERRTIGAVTKNIGYTYNLDGSLATLAPASGRTITYTYSAAARALSAVDTANSINFGTAATYAPHGALATMVNGYATGFAGITTANSYSKRLQPVILSASAPSQTVFSLSYDFHLGAGDNGDVFQIVNNRDSNRAQSFTYDQLNRIAFAWTSGALWGERFEIDPWGNLNKIRACQSGDPCYGKPQGENLDQSSSGKNQLNSFCYDAAGNLNGMSACPVSTYLYDAENRLKSTAGVNYTYDGDGKRVKKDNGKLYWTGTGSDPLTETDLSGTPTADYVFFNGKRIARVDLASGTVHYYFSDHLGSASVITSADGTTIEQESDYYPYGGERVITAGVNNYKFTGKERDYESSLDNFTARYFGSTAGRFMSADPMGGHVGDPQTLNRYAYVRNNSIGLTDPTGLDFYIKCTGKDGTGACSYQDVGFTKDGGAIRELVQGVWNENGEFTATRIGSDDNGNLIDKTTETGSYTGTFDGSTVTFTNSNGDQSQGVWAEGTAATSGITGGGQLDSRFSFTFSDHGLGQQLNALFVFHGTLADAEAALTNAGFYRASGINIGYDEFRLPSQGRDSTHFNVDSVVYDPKGSVPNTFGNMHTGEYDTRGTNLLKHAWHDWLHQ